jgi:hypothetical protein
MAYLIPARCGFKLTYMSVISSEVENGAAREARDMDGKAAG